MALPSNIVGLTGTIANVDISNNATVNLPWTDPSGVTLGGGNEVAGFATNLNESDAGSVTGVRDVKATEVTSNYRTRSGVDQTMLNENFTGSALNTTVWTSPVSVSTIVVGSNVVILNAGASVAANSVARISTYRSFPVLLTYPLYNTTHVQFTSTPVSNSVHEWGLFLATGTAAPTDGAYFTLNAAGEFRCIVNTNGTINQSAALDFTALVGVNQTHQFLIYAGVDVIAFWIDNIKVYEATLSTVSTLGVQTGSGQLPVSFRSYNSALVSGTANLMKVSAVNVTLAEMANSKAWMHIQSGAGMSSYQGQTSQTLGSTALYTNSLAAGAGAAMTNTTAALGSGLGGQFSYQPTLAAGTDGILSSYQVPAGSATAAGRTLYITGVSIQSAVTTALTGAPLIMAYSLAFGHNAVSLATTVSTTSKAPVRIPLGIESFVVTAAAGTTGAGVKYIFNTPVAVYPSEFVQIVAKNLGTVTSAGVVTALVTFDGYWE